MAKTNFGLLVALIVTLLFGLSVRERFFEEEARNLALSQQIEELTVEHILHDIDCLNAK